MKEEKRQRMQERLENSKSLLTMRKIQKYLDDYYLDAVAGFLPWGIGDILTALFCIVYIWFASFKVRSFPLVLAILNNSLRDIALGLIPFYIGDVIDFFYRSNKKNMELINGFISGDEATIKAVNKGAWRAGCFIILSILSIAFLLWALFKFTAWIWSFISTSL